MCLSAAAVFVCIYAALNVIWWWCSVAEVFSSFSKANKCLQQLYIWWRFCAAVVIVKCPSDTARDVWGMFWYEQNIYIGILRWVCAVINTLDKNLDTVNGFWQNFIYIRIARRGCERCSYQWDEYIFIFLSLVNETFYILMHCLFTCLCFSHQTDDAQSQCVCCVINNCVEKVTVWVRCTF